MLSDYFVPSTISGHLKVIPLWKLHGECEWHQRLSAHTCIKGCLWRLGWDGKVPWRSNGSETGGFGLWVWGLDGNFKMSDGSRPLGWWHPGQSAVVTRRWSWKRGAACVMALCVTVIGVLGWGEGRREPGPRARRACQANARNLRFAPGKVLSQRGGSRSYVMWSHVHFKKNPMTVVENNTPPPKSFNTILSQGSWNSHLWVKGWGVRKPSHFTFQWQGQESNSHKHCGTSSAQDHVRTALKDRLWAHLLITAETQIAGPVRSSVPSLT